jgi:hypothetical protein
MRAAAAELSKAKEAEAESDAQLDRLISIIRDADAAEAAVQEAIAADRGVALKAYSDGKAPDHPTQSSSPRRRRRPRRPVPQKPLCKRRTTCWPPPRPRSRG